MKKLDYTPLEKLQIRRPVDRIVFIKSNCYGKKVIDMGCYDETALIKLDTTFWLHREICHAADEVIGIDNAAELPETGKKFFENEYMFKCDVLNFAKVIDSNVKYDIVIAGELIEHLQDTLDFLKTIKKDFKGEYLLLTTPNAVSLSNVLLGLTKRESCHKDHYQVYSYKTLNTLLIRAGFTEWEIIPYHVKYTEMILNSKGLSKIIIKFFEKVINLAEYIFPLLSGGLIVKIKI
ncbi:MAG: methyltransferase domain-containing protein [Ignavibacteria bacterium]|nr:methyltransferase domain-containing protein [Ignavibacteria bacterium]